jgi:UDP-2,3-diacylglucosamine pyrophosphatase LpxH
MNSHIPHLSQFVRRLADRCRTSTTLVELIINGDFLDFLAQEGPADRPWHAFIDDPHEALSTFREIRDQDRDVFEALRALLEAGADLTLLLGNHDIELSFPSVRQLLQDDLYVPHGGRLKFIYDGEAYVVGDVLIEHGNRYDGFNVIDHDRMRRLRSAMSRRQPLNPPDSFEPPPGSRLVEQVMNPLKQSYGFIDLLKPETEAVVPLLIALEPGFASDIERLWTVWQLKSEAARLAPVAPGQPAHPGLIGISGSPAGGQSALQSMLGDRVEADQLARLEALTEQTRVDASTTHIGVKDDLRQAWSLLRLGRSGADREKRMRILLDALRTLQHDTSFDPTIEAQEVLVHANHLTNAGFKVVVFGHTHLAKQVRLDNGATYLNTGTWADLMRLPASLFDRDQAVADRVLETFVQDLHEHAYDRYLIFNPTYAHVTVDVAGQALSAALHTFDPEAKDFP